MKFARKKEEEYVRLYDKKTAIKMLKKDRRVKKIIIKRNKDLIVYTKPISPITSNNNNEKEIFLAPIGTYKIIIYGHSIRLAYDIFRVNGGVGHGKRYIHLHITISGECSSSCFGTASDEVSTIRSNEDWYWLVIRCLDLLEDGDREEGSEDIFYYVMIKLQIEYLNRSKGYGYVKKIRKLWEIFEDLDKMWGLNDW